MGENEHTGRERIVDSALALFADRGPDAVSLRDVAAHAGVSAALIVHHFGSREGLAQAVDDHVIGIFDRLADDLEGLADDLDGSAAGGVSASGLVESLLAGLPEGSPVPAYLRRMLLGESHSGTALFRRWYALTEEILDRMRERGALVETDDPRMQAAFLLVGDLAMILLHRHVHDALGIDPLTAAGSHRWATTAIAAYTDGVFRKDRA